MQAAVAALFPVDIPAELFPEKGAVERIFQPLPFSVNGKSQFTLNLFHHPHTADIKGVDHIVDTRGQPAGSAGKSYPSR